jgi:hypothetical protein
LERTVKEQEQVVADMKLHMVQASAEQIVSQHAMKKVMREYSVEKQSVENQMIAKDIEIKKVRLRVGVRVWAGFFGRGLDSFEVYLCFVGKEKGALLTTHIEGTGEIRN